MNDYEVSSFAGVRIVRQPRHEDSRGFLQKIITSSQVHGDFPQGEIYVSAGYPGMPKGNHYHLEMGEWFAVVQGSGIIEICDPQNGKRRTIPLETSQPTVVYVPKGLAHAVVNTGEDVLICVVAAEREHDPDDVYPYQVWPIPD